MKGQRRGRNLQRFANAAGGNPLRAGLHQQSEDGQPGFLGECGQGKDGGSGFHISTIMEM
jgi:hypothetical protein